MQSTRRRLLVATSGLALAAGMPAFAATVKSLGGPALGAAWRLTVPSHVLVGSLQRDLQIVIDEVDRAMSPFRRDSRLSLFNDSASTNWIELGQQTCDVLAEGLRVARFTLGAFDPTVGPLVGRYGFGPIRREAVGNYQLLEVRSAAARKADARLSLDLCGVAKGYAIDRMAEVVRLAGVGDFLLDVGGELLARGRHPGGRAWQVAIENPLAASFAVQRLVRLQGAALATSGDRVNSYWLAGRRYCHIIDPRSRQPADNKLASVSVLAPNAATADALATALFVMGERAGVDFARHEGLAAHFIARAGSGMNESMTGAFERHVVA